MLLCFRTMNQWFKINTSSDNISLLKSSATIKHINEAKLFETMEEIGTSIILRMKIGWMLNLFPIWKSTWDGNENGPNDDRDWNRRIQCKSVSKKGEKIFKSSEMGLIVSR